MPLDGIREASSISDLEHKNYETASLSRKPLKRGIHKGHARGEINKPNGHVFKCGCGIQADRHLVAAWNIAKLSICLTVGGESHKPSKLSGTDSYKIYYPTTVSIREYIPIYKPKCDKEVMQLIIKTLKMERLIYSTCLLQLF